MADQETGVERRRVRTAEPSGPQPAWPGDPESIEARDVDFEADAHVLANTCRRGGQIRFSLSLARHALTISSEEIEAYQGVPLLDGIADEDRRGLALHALPAGARVAWLGDGENEHSASHRAAARARTQGARIDRAVREAAGLNPEAPEEWAEVLRSVGRMTDAAEQGNSLVQGRALVRRDPGAGAGGSPFPPLRRAIRPMASVQAAERRLARLHELRTGQGHGGCSAAAPAAGAHPP